MTREQIDEIAFKVARESNLRLHNACGCSTCRERYDPPRIKAFTHALLAELVKVQEPIYLIRRKGFTDFYTCGYARLNTVSNHPELFEVKMVYEHPLPQPDLVAEIERVKTIADNYFAIATERSQQLSAAQQAIATQAAEIAELDALRNDAVLRLDKYKALCDQMGNALHFSHEETKGCYEEITGEDYNSPIINEALEAWRVLK